MKQKLVKVLENNVVTIIDRNTKSFASRYEKIKNKLIAFKQRKK